MGFFQDIHNRIKFARMNRRIERLPEAQQRKVGQKIYQEGYDAFKRVYNDNSCYGACTVTFDCGFEGHVAYHIEAELDRREKDADDPTVYAQVTKIGKDKWAAAAIVRMDTADHAMAAADACVMSAVLSAKTVSGPFLRYMSTIKLTETGLPDKETCMNMLAKISEPVVSGDVKIKS